MMYFDTLVIDFFLKAISAHRPIGDVSAEEKTKERKFWTTRPSMPSCGIQNPISKISTGGSSTTAVALSLGASRTHNWPGWEYLARCISVFIHACSIQGLGAEKEKRKKKKPERSQQRLSLQYQVRPIWDYSYRKTTVTLEQASCTSGHECTHLPPPPPPRRLWVFKNVVPVWDFTMSVVCIETRKVNTALEQYFISPCPYSRPCPARTQLFSFYTEYGSIYICTRQRIIHAYRRGCHRE